MAGDPLYVAVFDHLKAQLDECGLLAPWTVRDTRNTPGQPDTSRPYIDFEIIGAPIAQFSTGSPGANLHRETGQITIAFKVPFGDVDLLAEAGRYANLLLRRFLGIGTRFNCEDRNVRLMSPARMGGGEDVAGMWIETMAVEYERFLVG